MMVSVRSCLTVGLAATVVAASSGVAALAPVTAPALPVVASPAVELAASLQALPALPVIPDLSGLGETPGEWIINAYSIVQPWVAYGVELFAWATEWLPWPIGLLAPQANIIYSGWQPFAESVVYSFAFLVDGQFDLILPTLSYGIQTGVTNLIENEIAWILSFFPPLPPIGIGAATAPSLAAQRVGTAAVQSAESDAETVAAEPVEQADPIQQGETTETAPETVVAPEPVASTIAEPVLAPTPKRSGRGVARVPRAVPAPSAASVVDTAPADVAAVPTAATPDPDPVTNARKASRSDGSGAAAGGPSRAARAAR